ncbi:MAG: outer membrane protein [Arenicella sp.]|jgi:outer membrane protein
MKHKITIILLLVTIFQAKAQTEKWDLQKCIDYAMENNLQVRLNSLNIKSSKEALTLAEHARYPSLSAQVSHNYNWGLSFDVLTNQPVNRRVQTNGFFLGGNVPVYNGFRLRNQIAQAELSLKGSELDLEQNKNLIALNIVGAYVQIIFNVELLSNSQRQVKNFDEQITRTQSLVDAGVLPRNNVLDLKSQKATSELQMVQAENALAISKLQLKQLLQITDDGAIEIVIPILPDPDASSVLVNASTVYSTAVDNQPNVKSADLAIESADMGIEVAKSNYLPTINLSYSLGSSYSSAQADQFQRTGDSTTVTQPIGFVNGTNELVLNTQRIPEFSLSKFNFSDQIDESFNQRIGITLNIPIYNRNQAKNSVAIAKIQSERAKLQSQVVKNDLRQTIEQAYQDAVAALKTYTSNEVQVEALQETFRITEERYNAGVSNITDFNVAQNNLNIAQSNLIRAKYDYIVKTKILDFYMGKELSLE